MFVDKLRNYKAYFIKKLKIRSFRIFIVIFTMFIIFLIMQIKLFFAFRFHKQNISATQKGKEESINNTTRLDIIDRNNVLLARSVLAYDFYIHPYKMINIEEDLNKIINIFPSLENKKEKILDKIRQKKQSGTGIILIKQHILSQEKEKILDNGIIGVEFQETQKRIYPHNNVASHIIGFLSDDNQGMMGIERYFNSYLTNPENKDPIQLSIDINIQNVTKHILEKYMKKTKSKSAVGLIINVKTGELISAISLPDFNPNNLRDYNNNDLFNRFGLGVYELGSVFKIFAVALALENGMPITKVYNTKDPFIVGDFSIHNFHSTQVREKMNIVEILQHSSNIGIARMIEEIGDFQKQRNMFKALGLLDKCDIEFSEIGKPLYTDRWKLTQAITRGYGHGIAVSPLSFIYAFASIIDNGFAVHPTILKTKDNIYTDTVQGRVISAETSKKIRKILRKVVKEGSGKQSEAEKYDVGGKTGTATKITKGSDRIRNTAYSKLKNLVSFVAAVPIENPQYAYYILLDEPSVDNVALFRISGGSLVAPAMKELISITGPMLNIPIVEDHM